MPWPIWILIVAGSLTILLAGVALSSRRSRVALIEVARLVPLCLALFRDVVRDPAVPRRAKIVPALGLVYLTIPIDLIPDFIPGLGHLDDALIVGWTLRHLIAATASPPTGTAIPQASNASSDSPASHSPHQSHEHNDTLTVIPLRTRPGPHRHGRTNQPRGRCLAQRIIEDDLAGYLLGVSSVRRRCEKHLTWIEGFRQQIPRSSRNVMGLVEDNHDERDPSEAAWFDQPVQRVRQRHSSVTPCEDGPVTGVRVNLDHFGVADVIAYLS